MVLSGTLREALLVMAEARYRMRVKGVVDHVDVSRRTLERRFRSETGKSPGTHVREVRSRIADLLLYVQVPVGRAAGTLGFARPGSFREEVKRRTGMTPSERARYLLSRARKEAGGDAMSHPGRV